MYVYYMQVVAEVRTRPCSEAAKGICSNLCRSRSAQSLKLLGDTATQVSLYLHLGRLCTPVSSLVHSHICMIGYKIKFDSKFINDVITNNSECTNSLILIFNLHNIFAQYTWCLVLLHVIVYVSWANR